MSRQLLEGPELVDTVEDGLWPVDEPTAHLLQVPQHGDVAVRLHPWRGHAHHRHLGVGGHHLLFYAETWRRRRGGPSVRVGFGSMF